MIETKDLTLEVKEEKLGELVTNALEIKAFVEKRLTEYKPENYIGKTDEAKKDRAELNKASKELNAKRLELEKRFMKPFDEFKAVIKDTTSAIDGASKKLDEIVKGEEEREKEEKRHLIEQFWTEQKFELVTLKKIFDEKWLNKTSKNKDTFEEIKARIKTILSDIKTLETLEDADILKQLYLDNLDMGAAIRKSADLKAYREKLAVEAKERAEREARSTIAEQQREIAKEEIKAQKDAPAASLAAMALDEVPDDDPEMSYTLQFTAKRSVLFALRQYMTDNGIIYKKL
jgi:hypothetical protein